ncbi:MAG: peptidylprolyl isomerase [Oscillospiraceae bacterium]|jgi:parvulin-like peptidyl-prolyl isomerase|nr:peptidylprolyl isomerase [Oscillospiraceae bacterium]
MLKKLKAFVFPLAAVTALTSCGNGAKGGDVVAWVTADVENSESMEITYDYFYKEYRYWLYGMQIDENDPGNDDYTRAMREQLINYQINDKRCLRAANDYGMGASSLTDEDLEQIEIRVEETKNNLRESMRSEAYSDFAKEPTDEQLSARVDMLYERFLRETGIDEETIGSWGRDKYITEKLLEYVVRDISVDDAELGAAISEMTEKAKEDFAADPNVYVYDYANYSVFIPPGCRSVRQILVKLKDDVIESIEKMRDDGDDEYADEYRDLSLEQIRGKAQVALDRLDAGEDFGAVMKAVSDDKEHIESKEGVYRIPPGFTYFGREYHDAVFALSAPGEYSRLVPTDKGWVIIEFDSLTAYTDGQWEEVREEVRELRLDYLKNNRKTDFAAELEEKYPYEIDKKRLMID